MKNYLVMITIGPVQDFISSARKLRDLWFGSHLLSELSKVIALELVKEGTLIFPCVDSAEELEKDSPLIASNKVLAEVKADADPARLVEKARAAWENSIHEYADTALVNKGVSINEEIFHKQVEDFGEFYGVWTEIDDGYSASKARLEKLMAGRKNFRQFKAPDWEGAGVPKNSLDGRREAVTGDNQKEIVGLIKKGERLDALGCIKRFYPLNDRQKKHHFDDLSSMALQPYISGLIKSGETDALRNFVKKFDESFPETFSEKNFRDVHRECFYADNESIKEAGAESEYKILKKTLGEPHKYACILVGDGDNMGRALDEINTADGHRTFSRKLGKFAAEIGSSIKKAGGSLIYAGGDDVMAYLPLHNSLSCCNEIRSRFAETMADIFNTLNLTGNIPTFSIGLVIVHHSEPLDNALAIARRAEVLAKEKGGRNALAVIQNKKAGSELSIVGKWGGDQSNGITGRLEAMCTLYDEQKLPATLGYQLRKASTESGDKIEFGIDMEGKLTPKNAAAAFVLRIFNQKEHSNALKALLQNQKSIRSLSDEMVIAHQISRAVRMSKGIKL